MEFVRIIKDSADIEAFIDIPPGLRNQKVELIILPYTEPEQATISPKKTLKGALSKYKNESLHIQERDAWQQAVTDSDEDY